MGHERKLVQDGTLRAPKACEFREEGRWFYLKTRTGELKYPRPDNLVTVGGKNKFEKDELIAAAYHTSSPIFSLNALNNLRLLYFDIIEKPINAGKLIILKSAV